MVKDKLIDPAMQSSERMMAFVQVKKSLASDSARIWIHEHDSTLHQTDKDATEVVALEISQWLDNKIYGSVETSSLFAYTSVRDLYHLR